MNYLLFLFFIGLVVWLWYDALRYREYAISRCRKICNELNVQLLDQTVSMSSISLRKDTDNHYKIVRRYNFEISIDGANRFNGFIILSGYTIIHTEFDLPDGPVILQNSKLITYH